MKPLAPLARILAPLMIQGSVAAALAGHASAIRLAGSVPAPHLARAARTAVYADPPPCRTATAPAVVYALAGSVYRVDPDGSNRCRLTPFIDAKEPHLSPGGKGVAFLSGVGSNGYGAGAVNTVRVERVGGPLSSGIVVRVGRGVHRWPTWSPSGQMLAFVGESGVWVWRVACRCVRLVLRETLAEAGQTTIAWSPDSRRLAVAFVPTTSATLPLPPWDHLRVSIADLATGRRHAIVVRFPAWLRGNSIPSGIIAWLPTGKLLLRTSGLGVGLALTGIWMASLAGGIARLIAGAPTTSRLVLRFPLLNATQALVSPDGTKLLFDPGNRLWIASSSGSNERVLNPGVHGSCFMSQVVWVGNSHLAYICITGEAQNVYAQLYALSLIGGHPNLLASIHSRQQDALSIGPPTRCIACGGA